jgi:MraZ protein
MFFVGMYELTIDAKNRLSIPHAIRSKLNADTDGRSYYIVPGQRRGTLAIYPERYYERTRAQIPSPEQISDGGYEWRQFEFSQSALLDPDNQGRILIPERLLKRAGIGKEVTLIGVQDRLELWSRPEFDAFQDGKWPDYPQYRSEAMQELRQLQASGMASGTPAAAGQ